VSDYAVACAFVSYCGPFNQDFRKYMINEKFRKDCDIRAVPVTKNLDDERLLYFLVCWTWAPSATGTWRACRRTPCPTRAVSC
jgi:hypothetical protein